MKSVEELARDIVIREGGFVNDPDDPGGPTNLGVTLTTLRRLGFDLDGDGDVDIDDLKRLTSDQASGLFLEHYFRKPRIDALPQMLQASVFDMYVNAGANAIRILQQLLIEMDQPCKVDGAIGPETVRCCRAAAQAAPSYISDAYGIARRNYYYALADRRPSSRKFARRYDGGKGGWIKRAEEFISPRYHLRENEHRARVAKWDL